MPINKIYRAFPELDQFSDEQCERFIARCRASVQSTSSSPAILGAVLMTCGGCCVGQLALMPLNQNLDRYSRTDAGFMIVVGGSMAGWMLLPTVAGLIARDWILQRNLRRIIWRNIERIRCPQCRYLLLGQRVANGLIHCPECGGTTTLAAIGLESEEDLIPPHTIGDELTVEARE